MKGLMLAKAYYEEYGRPMLRERFSDYAERIAAGLVGHGSECYGFDDALSRDHDFGPSFCLWLERGDFEQIGDALQAAYDSLPGSYMGFRPRIESREGGGRVGVLEIGAFYRSFIGRECTPESNLQWLRIPMEPLAAVTNGMVFEDLFGRFTALREGLLRYYPEDVRLKKLAANIAGMAQSGQYNYGRCMQRGELVAARIALCKFIRHAMAVIYLLNRAYMPFYKWAHRGMREMDIPSSVYDGLIVLSASGAQAEKWHAYHIQDGRPNTADDNVAVIEDICGAVLCALRRQKLTMGEEDFLDIHARRIMERIQDPEIRRLPIMEGA